MSATAAGREILLVAHTGRENIADTAARVAAILGDGGIGVRVLADEDTGAQLARTDDPDDDRVDLTAPITPEALHAQDVAVTMVANGPDAAVGCEMVVVLGGDGTFLRAAELARSADVPVLGINLGRIGFLAEAEAEHLDEALAQVVRREYRVEHRMTLDVSVRTDGQILGRGWALNEMSIENGPRLGVLELLVELDGRPVSAYGCDGMLVSTPTGSTAYAFSAGGPVVWPELEAILVVPSNAHALFARPMVISPYSVVAVDVDPAGHGAVVYCDGRRTIEVPAGGRVEVVRGRRPVKWIRLDSAPFADRLVRKFQLPVQGWRGTRH
ncbi:NAD kinase [Rhodococcus sp. D2-41]|uniref:NAD kinase n=1 Tax=Speluncibacter jeojiensis TaxID=2710754 RepID=A0A9X4M7H2_9ACTN|nr:NAD kinase [Rhodococcus sp. D2-41]MDG3012882.1 NAD kinase [Rhodococcus sp. D2-41]MDG3016683.1 NAD kinase [Corynebacteriales bacterium D3-21]